MNCLQPLETMIRQSLMMGYSGITINQPMEQRTMKAKLPTIRELAEIVRHVSQQVPRVSDSDAADYIDKWSGDPLPSIDLTIGWDPETGEWSYQTGDNSFTGGAYGYPIWAVTTIYRRRDSRAVARGLIDQLED